MKSTSTIVLFLFLTLALLSSTNALNTQSTTQLRGKLTQKNKGWFKSSISSVTASFKRKKEEATKAVASAAAVAMQKADALAKKAKEVAAAAAQAAKDALASKKAALEEASKKANEELVKAEAADQQAIAEAAKEQAAADSAAEEAESAAALHRPTECKTANILCPKFCVPSIPCSSDDTCYNEVSCHCQDDTYKLPYCDLAKQDTVQPVADQEVECVAGQFKLNDICVSCPAGSTSKEGASKCDRCPRGQYADQAGMTSCFECPTGSYVGQEGSTQCKMCAAGQGGVKGSTGAINSREACVECSAGTWSDREGKEQTCSECAAGTASATTGSSYCDKCSVGTYTNSTGCTECDKCPIGTVSSSLGASSKETCINCEKGMYV